MESDDIILSLMKKYERLGNVVDEKMHRILKKGDFPLLQITHRIKTLESIKEKLKRKADLYPDAYALHDILGFRAICYFSSNVDLVAKRIADAFRVDWSLSTDKRKLIDARSFGYMSLHYICSLPEEEGELSNLLFEIQIKTILQHSWAEIEHDLGYKTEIEVPRDIRRSFSRAASLLETTDIIFSDIKKQLENYRIEVKENIENGKLDEIYFDGISLLAFTEGNPVYRGLLDEIAAITGAHLTEGTIENLLPQIEFFGISTFRDMIKLIEDEHGMVLELARESLQDSGLDELSSTVAYHYLFRAKLIHGNYNREKIREYFKMTINDEKRVEHNVTRIMNERDKCK